MGRGRPVVTVKQIEDAVRKHSMYYCPKCLWTSELNIGMKNECPNCKSALNFMTGNKQDIKHNQGGPWK